MNFTVRPNIYGPSIEGVDKRFVKHQRSALVLTCAYDKKLKEVPVPKVSDICEKGDDFHNATAYQCAEFAVGYVFACKAILGISGIKEPFELKRA